MSEDGNSPKPVLPPPSERVCVQAGLAEVRGTSVAYYWKRIAKTWLAWPGSNLAEFCRVFHIPVQIATPRLPRSEKLKALARLSQKRNEVVLKEMTVELVRDAQSEGRQLGRTLDAIQQIGGLGVTFALARIAKFTSEGLLPVASLPSAEVRRCVEIAAKAAEMLERAQQLRVSLAGNGSSDASRAVPTVRVDDRPMKKVESVSKPVG